MLYRRLAHSISRPFSPLQPSTCAVCTCRCGQVLSTKANGPAAGSQRRHVRSAPRSPAVREERREQKRKAQNVQQEKETRRLAVEDTQRIFDFLIEERSQRNYFHASAQNVKLFLGAFRHHMQSARSGHLTVDSSALRTMLEDFGLKDDDATVLSQILLLENSEESRYLGKKLLFSMSHEENDLATMFIMHQTLVAPSFQKSKLLNPELSKPRAHLTSLAQADDSPQAMVLEGRVAFALGNESAAIKLWTRSISAAAKVSAFVKDRSAGDSDQGFESSMLYDLSTPWLELANLHSARGEHDKALWAMEVGTLLDDPISHYQRAQYAKLPDEAVGSSSTWLYHITKAAASSHPKAAHELGLFYAMSCWKYVEDEPPDAVKPTPFDSFPADITLQRSTFSISERIQMALGLRVPLAITGDSKDEIFPSAIFPSTPEARMQMAFRWLKVAMDLFYAPSYLATARLLLADTLWGAAAAPPEAQSLSASRYTYASRADYEAGKRIKQASQQQASPDPPNPSRNPEEAKSLLREVLYAVAAQRELGDIWQYTSERRGMSISKVKTLVAPTNVNEAYMTRLVSSPHLAKWYRFPEVRAMYTDDDNGLLIDSAQQIRDLEREVHVICEQNKWDIYGHDGGLLFRHGLTPVKRKAKTIGR